MQGSEFTMCNIFAEEAPSEGQIPIHVDPFTINDTPPEEVMAILNKLHDNKAAGVSGLTAEDLKSWHKAARVAVVLGEKVLEMVRLVLVDVDVDVDVRYPGLLVRESCTSESYRIDKEGG